VFTVYIFSEALVRCLYCLAVGSTSNGTIWPTWPPEMTVQFSHPFSVNKTPFQQNTCNYEIIYAYQWCDYCNVFYGVQCVSTLITRSTNYKYVELYPAYEIYAYISDTRSYYINISLVRQYSTIDLTIPRCLMTLASLVRVLTYNFSVFFRLHQLI